MKRLGVFLALILFSACGEKLPEIDPAIFNGSGMDIPAGISVVTFTPAPGSAPGSVILSGTFDSQMEGDEEYPMVKGEDGVFRLEFNFESGKNYFFEFIVDGEYLSAYYAYGMYSPEATWMTPPENFFGHPISDPRGCWEVEDTEGAE